MVDFTAPGRGRARTSCARVAAGVPVRRRHERLGHGRGRRRGARGRPPGLLRAELRHRRRADDALRRARPPRTSPAAEIVELHHDDEARRAVGHRARDRRRLGGRRADPLRPPARASSRTRRCCSAGAARRSRSATTRRSREAFVPGVLLALEKLGDAPAGRHRRPRRAALSAISSRRHSRRRARALAASAAAPEALLDEEAFARRRVPAVLGRAVARGSALAAALPRRLDGLRVVELGCGLGVPSLVAARRGARVSRPTGPPTRSTCCGNAARNGIELRARVWDWREPWHERFDLALGGRPPLRAAQRRAARRGPAPRSHPRRSSASRAGRTRPVPASRRGRCRGRSARVVRVRSTEVRSAASSRGGSGTVNARPAARELSRVLAGDAGLPVGRNARRGDRAIETQLGPTGLTAA